MNRALVAVVLAACCLAGRSVAADDLVTPVRVGRTDAPLTLTVWAQQDYSHLAARPDIASVFSHVFEQWAETHPGTQLRVSVMPALEQHKAKLLLAAAAGRLPDVASIDSFWLPLFLDGGHVQPLNDGWPERDRADFLPFTIRTLSDGQGRVYGMWHETDCRVLFYRRDLVPVPPRSWAELLSVASRVSKERGIAGYLYNAGRWEATVFDNLAMFWAQGGELVDAKGRPIFGESPNRERMLRVLAFLRDTIRTGASPRSVLSSNDYQQLTSAAVAGDVAMFLGGNWQLADLRANLSPDDFARWDVAPIPQLDPSTAATGTGGWIWVVFAKDRARRQAAIEFIRTVEAPANAARISEATGHLPVRQSLYRTVPLFATGWYARFGDIVRAGRARPAVPIYPAISDQLQLAIGYVVAGARSPEDALEQAWRSVQSEYARRSSTGAAAPARWTRLVGWLPPLIALAGLTWLLGSAFRSGPSLVGWLIPAAAAAAAMLVYPMLDLVRTAFTSATLAGGHAGTYSLASFEALFRDPAFAKVMAVTLVFVAGSVALQISIGLFVAYAVDAARRRQAPGTLVARLAVVSAWVIPGVLVGVLWKILLMENRSGLASYWLSLAGLGPRPWLSSGGLALMSVIVANTWRGCAFSMIFQFAALQQIPRELHEAADLERASGWQRLRWVVWPQIAPAIALNVVLITMYTLNTFDLILPLTGGGPAQQTEVISLFMYRLAFFDLQAGRAAAAAVVLLGCNLVLIALAVRLLRAGAARGEAGIS
jgi:multiple sugar transport system substrate-binding protein